MERCGVPQPTLDADRLNIMVSALPFGAGLGRLIDRFGVRVPLVRVTAVEGDGLLEAAFGCLCD